MSEKKKDKPRLVWNVFTKNSKDEIIVFNVFDHFSFMNDLIQIKKMKYSELPDYDDIWFEGTATYLGKHYHKYTD